MKTRPPSRLESNLGCQLDAARSPAAKERVADAHVTGGGDWIEALAYFAGPTGTQGKAIERRISNKRRQKGIGEVRMVGEVENVSAKLQ